MVRDGWVFLRSLDLFRRWASKTSSVGVGLLLWLCFGGVAAFRSWKMCG